MTKNVAKKRANRKFSFPKRPRFIVAILFIMVFASIGVYRLTRSHALTTMPATYVSTYPSCTPMCHTTGEWAGFNLEMSRDGSIIDVPIWRWPAGSLKDSVNYKYQTSHYFQWGPYHSVYIPTNRTGLHVCFHYAPWGMVNNGGYIRLGTNLNYSGITRDNGTSWFEQEIELKGRDLLPQMVRYCAYYPLQKGRTYYNVEYRLKVRSTTDTDAQLDLWKTTVAYY